MHHGIWARIGEIVREVTKLRAHVLLVTPGSLPNDDRILEGAGCFRYSRDEGQ